jgi:hypothetical protein
MSIAAQMVLVAVGVGVGIVVLGGFFRNLAINIITAPLLGVLVAVVPAGLTDDMLYSRALWIVATAGVFIFLEQCRLGPELDLSRPVVTLQRRSAARRTIRSEVKRAKIEPARNYRFEVENG